MKYPESLNQDIVPLRFPECGEHPETSFQEDLSTFFLQFGIQRIDMPILTTDFFSFDFLGMPEYSPVRSNENIIRLAENDTTRQDIHHDVDDIIARLHHMRFGLMPPASNEKKMLVSHTTAQLVANIYEHGPREIYTISKTFREKKEKREKTQAEVVLLDRSIPDIISFMEKLCSSLSRRPITLGLFSDFYYFLEPSFSFSTMIDGKAQPFGSAGFVRAEVMEVIRKMHPTVMPRTIAFIGIPYLKLLNLRLGERFNDFDIDYNSK